MASQILKFIFQTDIAQFKSSLGQGKRSLEELGDEAEKAGKKGKTAAQDIGDSFQRTGASLTQAGMTAAKAITLPLVAIGTAAFTAANAVDNAMDIIRAKTGATGKTLEGLGEDFRKVFGRVPQTAAEVGTAIGDLNTRLGLTGKPLQDMATQILNLARITNTDLNEAIRGVTRVFGDWSIKTEHQSDAADRLFKVTQLTGIALSRLTDITVQYGAPLRQMGFSFAEATALVGKFEKEGVNTELVLASLRIALITFAKAGEAPTQALQRMISEIKKAGSASAANKLAVEVFGARAGPDMAAAIREGRFEIQQLIKDLDRSRDTINQAAKDTESFSEKWGKLRNAVTLALEPLGKSLLDVFDRILLPKMTSGSETVKQLTTQFTQLTPETQTVILGMTGLAAALPLVAIALGTVISSVGKLIPLLVAMATPVGALVIGITALAAAYAVLTLKQNLEKAAADQTQQSMLEQTAKAHNLVQALKSHQVILEKVSGETLPQWIVRAEAAIKTQELMKSGQTALATATRETGNATQATTQHLATLNVTLEKLAQDKLPATSDSFKLGTRDMSQFTLLLPTTSKQLQFVIKDMSELKAKFDGFGQDLPLTTRKIQDFKDVLPKPDDANMKGWERHIALTKELSNEVSLTFDRLASRIADAIVDWKGFGAAFLETGKSFVKAMLEIFIKELFSPLKEWMGKVAKGFADWLKGIFTGAKTSFSDFLKGIFTGGAGGGGGAGGAGGAFGAFVAGGTAGALLLKKVFGGGAAGAVSGGAAGGIAGLALLGAKLGAAGGIGAGAGALGVLAGLFTNPITAPIAIALLLAGPLKALFSKSPSEKFVSEAARDLGGVKIPESVFKDFLGQLGVSEKASLGIRKDLAVSPKFLTEIAFPLALQQGKIESFLSALSRVQTNLGPGGATIFTDFRTAFEEGFEGQNFDRLNQLFKDLFSNSRALVAVLPDLSRLFADVGTAAGLVPSPGAGTEPLPPDTEGRFPMGAPGTDFWQRIQREIEAARGFQGGGIVPGPVGRPQLAVVHGGETISPAGARPVNVTLNVHGNIFTESDLREFLARAWTDMAKRGGFSQFGVGRP